VAFLNPQPDTTPYNFQLSVDGGWAIFRSGVSVASGTANPSGVTTVTFTITNTTVSYMVNGTTFTPHTEATPIHLDSVDFDILSNDVSAQADYSQFSIVPQ